MMKLRKTSWENIFSGQSSVTVQPVCCGFLDAFHQHFTIVFQKLMVKNAFCCRFLFTNKKLSGKIQIEPSSAIKMKSERISSINQSTAGSHVLSGVESGKFTDETQQEKLLVIALISPSLFMKIVFWVERHEINQVDGHKAQLWQL